jgi:hypothetical protein
MSDESTMTNDSTLKRDVENELKWEPCVNAAHIGVSATDGIVTLWPRLLLRGEARRREGGHADLRHVQLPGSTQRTDEDIAQARLRALEPNFWVPEEKIKVVVHMDGSLSTVRWIGATPHTGRYSCGVGAKPTAHGETYEWRRLPRNNQVRVKSRSLLVAVLNSNRL